MFNFIKKAGTGVTLDKEDRERRKKDKKERKEKQKRDRTSMSAEELLRLDEVRRSLKIRGRRKEKDKLPLGITADYTADFLASLDRVDDSPNSTISVSSTYNFNHHIQRQQQQDGYNQSDSSEASLNSLTNNPLHRSVPPVPPKPPKRGILKGPRISIGPPLHHQNGTTTTDHVNLVRNTLQNEVIGYQNLPPPLPSYPSHQNGICKDQRNLLPTSPNLGSNLLMITSTSPSADSLTDTTNSSFATPPFSLSPVGESQGYHRWSRTPNLDDTDLPLPPIVPLVLPKPRTLTIQRQRAPRNDFGFSLRRAMVVERNDNNSCGVEMKAVVFAEPGTMVQHNNETGLLPGDKLLEVNGIRVDEKTREEIIDLIKGSRDSVTVKVQPVAELSELSRRSGHDGREIVLDDANIRGGTLRRSGSRRFNKSATLIPQVHVKCLPNRSMEATFHLDPWTMYHLQKAFENSLRFGNEPSPKVSKKNVVALQHRACIGKAHACGNYQRDGTLNCNHNSNRTEEDEQQEEDSTNVAVTCNNKNLKSSSGASSEGQSESDSLDSLNEKKPSCGGGGGGGGSGGSNHKHQTRTIIDRLHSTGTKASQAKTAKMRYLELDDEEENGTTWMQDLRKSNEQPKKDKKEKKQRRRERLKKVLDDKIELTTSCSSATPDNGHQHHHRANRHVKNGVVVLADVMVEEEGHTKPKEHQQTNNNAKRPPWNSSLNNSFRASFRRGVRRNYKNAKTVTWEEIVSISEKQKLNDRNHCLKDLDELLHQQKCKVIEEDEEAPKAKSEEQVATEKQWLDAERIWLVHRGGFAAARKDTTTSATTVLEPGKLRIRLEHTGDVLDVDEDDVEKANPPQFDRVEDLATLRHLNESSVLHTLRQRYATNLIHTYAGNGTLLVVNPMAPLAIYSEKVIALFRGCKSEDMPPHIYSMAQSAYHNMLSTRRDQSVAFLGRSGSGKTTNFRHSIQYLVTAAGTVNKILTVEKLSAIWNVLESFGNCKTTMNTNATRFTQIFSLDFDQSGVIASASIQILMLERSRVAKKVDSETTFHVMYRLLSGVEGNLRKELFLEHMSGNEQNAFITLLQKHEDKQRAQAEFVKLRNALHLLDVTEQEQKAIWSVLAAIFHLGCAGATKVGNTNNRYQFVNPQSAQRAAHLLGTTVEELSRVSFGLASGGLGTPNAPRAPFRTPSPTEKGLDRDVVGLEALEGMIVGLYAETFNCVASLINRSISASTHTVSSILLIDTPGFQNPASCGKQTGASFEDLCHNYLQERLQLLYYHTNLIAPRDRYVQENIELPCEENENDGLIDPMPLINMLDKATQNTVFRSSQTDLHEGDRRGLLWLLDEEAIYPGSSDDSFLERLFTHFGDRDHQLLLRKAPGNNQFILQHLQGTNPVLYSCNGWLKCSRENPISRAAVSILQESCKEELSKLFVGARGLGPSSFNGSVVGIEGSQSLRRASSIRRTFTAGTAAIKRKSICLQTKFIIDGLVETLRRTKLRFVHCLLPQHNAGHCETNTALLAAKSAPNQAEDAVINVPLLRSQIRGGQILESVRLYKQGFPHFLPLSEFRRRFQLLAADFKPKNPVMDERKTVEDMLLCLDLDLSSYRVGLSQIFFRSGVLTQLETQRDEKLGGMVINLQSHCRGYLARKKLTQRKLQDLAVRCIQRNVRKFMVYRDWPWWRLLVRVTPLLNVHRTEEELRNKTEELELLRVKVEKLETERTTLKHENDKLEAKLSELTADLAEEHSTSTLATERLDAETSERMRIERELSDVQNKNKSLQDASERLEMELLYAKSEMNGISEEDEEGDGDGGIYKQRYERARRELEFTKKRLQQQHEDDLEQLVGLKKQLEKKLTDAYEEVEEQRQVVGQWKRKVQKLNGETNDLRLLLEEQNARNNLLEKKQRKFDAETQLLQDELRQERIAKERLGREKEAIIAERFSIESNLADARLELDLKEDKLQSLQRELDELTNGGKTEEEVTILRRQKIDCERRLHDQDEELDELAGQVQLLEQAKLRLEMTLESQRKEAKKEAQQRDEELEEVRCNAQKKVKALEAQLENEHEERTILLREKHELERRLAALAESERNDRAGDEALLNRLKRDLKRTKALLRDTQSQLERQKADSPGKALIRQLRNQIEDLECARSVAVKAKQSLETDLVETQGMLDEANKHKSEMEEKTNALNRERSDLQAQLEENEEELAEVIKKYKAAVQQMSLDQITLQEQVSMVSELESEKNHLKEQLVELTTKLESVENMGETSSNLHLKRMELKTKELESKFDLEQTTRSRLEVQITRLKEAVDKLQTEVANSRTKEQLAQEQVRKLQRSLRELKEEHNSSLTKEAEYVQKRKDLEKRCELAEAETAAAKADLKLALKRIEDLQLAIQGELEDTSEHTDSEQDSYTSEESVSTFLTNTKISSNSSSSTMKMDRNSVQFESRRLSSASRSSTSSSIHGKDYSYA